MAKSKIVKLETLKKKIILYRKQGYSIAWTNGCFDILHYGHITYLQASKKNKRILIVGLNSDQSVRKNKGPQRPIISQTERAPLLAALECVDYVLIFNEDTPLKMIKALKPDILIKGADWKGKEVIGEDNVKQYGGKVEYIQYLSKFSSTKIIRSIIQKCGK